MRTTHIEYAHNTLPKGATPRPFPWRGVLVRAAKIQSARRQQEQRATSGAHSPQPPKGGGIRGTGDRQPATDKSTDTMPARSRHPVAGAGGSGACTQCVVQARSDADQRGGCPRKGCHPGRCARCLRSIARACVVPAGISVRRRPTRRVPSRGMPSGPLCAMLAVYRACLRRSGGSA